MGMGRRKVGFGTAGGVRLGSAVTAWGRHRHDACRHGHGACRHGRSACRRGRSACRHGRSACRHGHEPEEPSAGPRDQRRRRPGRGGRAPVRRMTFGVMVRSQVGRSSQRACQPVSSSCSSRMPGLETVALLDPLRGSPSWWAMPNRHEERPWDSSPASGSAGYTRAPEAVGTYAVHHQRCCPPCRRRERHGQPRPE